MAVSKGVIIGIVLAVVFVGLVATAGIGFVAWRYYSAQQRLREVASAPPTTPDNAATPSSDGDMTPAPEAATPEVTEAPTEQATAPAEAPTEEPAAATIAPTPKPKTTRAPKKTAAPAVEKLEEPAATPEPERERPKPKVMTVMVGHIHGGFKKKMCQGAMQLTDTGFKYDATTSEDDRQDHVEYRFDQIKKAELKDPKTVEISTTDKKWTFTGDGLDVSRIVTHINTHSKQLAGK